MISLVFLRLNFSQTTGSARVRVRNRGLIPLSQKIPNTPAAVISTDKKFITFLKLRLEFVAIGEFEFPNAEISDPFKVE